MQDSIERIPISSISYDGFIEEFYLPEKPIILTGVQALEKKHCNPDYIKSKFQARTRLWHSAEFPAEGDEVKVPLIVRKLSDSSETSLREKPMRIWMQPKGNKTIWHYDGNALHVFNTQLEGKKHWTIVSPKSPLRIMSFLHYVLVGENYDPQDKKVDFIKFDTNPGDMLFLPRYWVHRVESLEAININVNWVMTPKAPNLEHAYGRRECELLELRRVFPILERILGRVNDFGGGDNLAKIYTRDVRTKDVFLRLMKEIKQIPISLYFGPRIALGYRKTAKHNFNLQGGNNRSPMTPQSRSGLAK